MKVYLLLNEAMLGYKHNITVTSNTEIKDKFLLLNKDNKYEEFELDDENILSLINKGSSSQAWTEFWRKSE